VLYAIIGDIHGNLHALSAVLKEVRQAGVDRVLCVGDLVGYGAHPAECMQLVREMQMLTVGGNHDWAVAGKVSIQYFNADARDSVEWTREHLCEEEIKELTATDLVAITEDVTLVHSTLFAPEEFDYMQTLFDVQLSFKHLQTGICFCGHSHVPVMLLNGESVECFLTPELELSNGQQAIVNVGSVGQPRDLDPRACYVLYDSALRKVTMRRAEYDVHAASESILQAGLPITNARRLVLGR
jgi:predicted phosphodiesterase